MTLSARLNLSNKSGLVLCALIPFFFACNDPNSLGVELDDDNAKTRVDSWYIDLPLSVFYIDSLRNEDRGDLAFGDITGDPVFGSVRAIAYSDYNPTSTNYPSDTAHFFEGAFVSVRVKKALINAATAQTQKIKVFEAADTLFSSVRYLANMHTEYDESSPIGELNSEFDLGADSTIQIPLDSAWGVSVFEFLQQLGNDDIDIDSLIGTRFFPALVFEPSSDNQNLLTFDLNHDTTGIYIAMANDTGYVEHYKFDFFTDHYSEIIRDRSGSLYADLTDDYSNKPITTGNAHLNTLAGLHPSFNIQPIIDLVESNDDIIINRAELFVDNVPDSIYDPVSQIQYYFRAKSGKINGTGANSNLGRFYAVLSNEGYFGQATGNQALLKTNYNSSTNQYADIVTFFCQSIVDTKIAKESSTTVDYVTRDIILFSPEPNLAEQSAIPATVQMRVYFTELK